MDQNKYVNTYIDIIIGQLHEILNSNLQLRTQVKISNDLILEKDQIIGELQNQLVSLQNTATDIQKISENAKYWEDSYHSMVNKVSHMDELINQVKEMKSTIQERDKTITELVNKIDSINIKNTDDVLKLKQKYEDDIEKLKQKYVEDQMPKKVINTKVKKIIEPTSKEKLNIDDF